MYKTCPKTNLAHVTTDVVVSRFGDDSIWVTLLKPRHNLRIQQVNAVQLVAKSYPWGEK